MYPQLSGVTATSLGAMVVVRQRLRAAGGGRTVTRVVDVRLYRSRGPWRLDRIGSVGGDAVPRPETLSPAGRRVVGDPDVNLSDSARWDIYRGDVDERLLGALAWLGERHRFSVSVLRSGHPRDVWQTSRPSAHSRGYAADIYAVDGRLVVDQRQPGGPAHALAASLVAGGAAQVGSPWVLGRGGARSFADPVHQDQFTYSGLRCRDARSTVFLLQCVGVVASPGDRMPKRTIVVVLVAVVVVAILSGMVASSLTAGGGDGTHAMPDGSTMRGDEMP